MPDLKISLIQSDIFWEQPQKNRAQFEEKIQTLAGKTDLIVLPEMFSTGFTMNVQQFAETMQGVTITWMKELSVYTKADLVGSVIIQEDGGYFRSSQKSSQDPSSKSDDLKATDLPMKPATPMFNRQKKMQKDWKTPLFDLINRN